MIRTVALICVVALVSACGGGSRYSSSNAASVRLDRAPSTPAVLFANGPIAQACRTAGRKQASRSRCGCVQAVADRSLSQSEQRKGAVFFKDPHKAQQTRQSDNPANERFWKKWKAYGNEAARLCT